MSLGGSVRRGIYWANDRLHGSGVRSQYDELSVSMGNPKEGRRIQREKLDRLLSYATENCPFFSSCDPSDLGSFPITDKAVMIGRATDILVPPALIPGQEGAVHRQRTSGSTGTPFEIAQDTQKRNRRVAELKWFNAMSGFESHERLGQCRIWTKWQSKSRWQSFCENIVPINISKMDDSTIEALCETVSARRLTALRAYASWYTALADYLRRRPEEVAKLGTLSVCFSSSEALDGPTREYLESVVGCSMVEAYANEENGLLGQQLPGSTTYVLNHSGYVFELLKLDSDEPAGEGEVGRIVLTDLHNYAYPFIRYDTGDTGVMEPDAAGAWPALVRLYGRRMDLIHDAAGNPVHPMVFARVLKNLPGIRQWQFVQKGRRSYELRINRGGEGLFDERSARAALAPVLGDGADLTFAYVEGIPVLASGKRRPVVCEWAGDGNA